jgi:hypothetical protein
MAAAKAPPNPSPLPIASQWNEWRRAHAFPSRGCLGPPPSLTVFVLGLVHPLRCFLLMLLAVLGCGCNRDAAPPPNPALPPNAPPDQPASVGGQAAADEYRAAIAPFVAKARETYPAAKKRYLEGLPAGHTFYIVTDLKDGSGAREQVFVVVSKIAGGRISGRIASDILGVKGYKNGDACAFSESEVIDWLISRPDGTEEGNVVGKFLDEWQKTKQKP